MKTVVFCIPLLGAAFLGGCGGPQAKARTSEIQTMSIAAAQKMKVASPVVVRGAMVEKCPVAGCWFKIHDATGTIKIDAKTAGFTVTEVPLQTQFTVRGKVVPNGAEKMIQATSADY